VDKTHFRLGVEGKKTLGPIMRNMNTSWLIVNPQVCNKILVVWGPMSSCVMLINILLRLKALPKLSLH